MNFHNDIDTYIDAYIKGQLQGADLEAFESEMLHNSDLAAEVKKATAIQKLVLQNRLLNVKNLAMEEETRLKNNPSGKFLKLAIGLVLLTAISAVAIYQFKEETKTINPGKESEPETETIHNPIDSFAIKNPDQKIEKKQPIQFNSNADKPVLEKTKQVDLKINSVDSSNITRNSDIENSINANNQSEHSFNSNKIETVDKIEESNPCQNVKLTAKVNTEPICKGSSDGVLEVNTIQGGTPPYQQKIYKNGNEIFTYSGLESGQYEIILTDFNNCEKQIKVTISEKICPINDHFNPGYGEIWNIPVTNKSGKLTIYNKTGLAIFQQNLINNTPATWNGKDKYDRLEAGYFIFVIEYEDGTAMKGSVTVTL